MTTKPLSAEYIVTQIYNFLGYTKEQIDRVDVFCEHIALIKQIQREARDAALEEAAIKISHYYIPKSSGMKSRQRAHSLANGIRALKSTTTNGVVNENK